MTGDSASPPVQTTYGALLGADDGAVRSFKGVRFAAPPVGDLRWRPPQPPERWNGVRAALAFGPDAMQAPLAKPRIDRGYSRAPGVSEDCLSLNVWAPAGPGPFPVMVWFHGGGFIGGSGAETTYDGAALARRGVVVVTANYRLGVFGYLSHPELTRESPHGASGNYGLLDNVAALAWVRDNIAAFGGDPRRVTIFGQSAGGANVGLLMVSPLSQGLFHRVILQSPGSFRPLGRLADAEALGAGLNADVGELRKLEAEAALELNARYVPTSRGLTTPRMLRPICDGWSVPEQESALFLAGRFAKVPMIVGSCTDEGSILIGASPIRTVAAYEDFVRQNFNEQADEALALYRAARDDDARSAYGDALSDTQFQYAARSLARVSAAHQPNTFRYLFTRQAPGAAAPAAHLDELPYVFGTLAAVAEAAGAPPPSEADLSLSDAIQDAWVRFAATSDPSGGALGAWPRYEAESDPYLDLGESTIVRHGMRRPQMDFLDRFYGLFQ